tara:strand:- start:845 stop:1042 length:198 start_codon:yes stop_codon:yes gene_type:complete
LFVESAFEFKNQQRVSSKRNRNVRASVVPCHSALLRSKRFALGRALAVALERFKVNAMPSGLARV